MPANFLSSGLFHVVDLIGLTIKSGELLSNNTFSISSLVYFTYNVSI